MFIKMKTAHDEEDIMLNSSHIILVTYFPESNMSKIDTTNRAESIWTDGNFMDVICSVEPVKEVIT